MAKTGYKKEEKEKKFGNRCYTFEVLGLTDGKKQNRLASAVMVIGTLMPGLKGVPVWGDRSSAPRGSNVPCPHHLDIRSLQIFCLPSPYVAPLAIGALLP